MKDPFIICIILLSLFGSVVIHYSTQWGPVVYTDATVYIDSARNLLLGHGLGVFAPSGSFRPLGNFPPFYPLVLGALGFVGIDLLTAARLLNIALFGMTILLIGLSFFTLSRSHWLSISLTLLILTSPELLPDYLSAMSEPLFFFTGFAGIFLLILYLEKPRHKILAAAAITTGLAFLTRIIGIAFIMVGALCLFIFQRLPLKRRIVDGAYFVTLSAVPMMIWRIWLYVQPHMVSTHRFQYTAGNIWTSLSPVRVTLVNIIWGLLPYNELFPSLSYRFKLIFILLIVLLFGVSFVLTIQKIRKQGVQDWLTHRGVRLASLQILFIVIYSIVLVVSYLYFHPTVHIGRRHFSPILFAALIAICCLCYLFIQMWPSRLWLQLLPIAVMLITVSAWLPRSYEIALEHHRNGAGFTSVRWRNSGTIEALKELPPDIPIITNGPSAVLFLTGRSAYEIDVFSRTEPLSDYIRYGDEMDDPIQKLFREDGAALVLFDAIYWEMYPIFGEETLQHLEAFTQGLRLYTDSWDGAIYFYSEAE